MLSINIVKLYLCYDFDFEKSIFDFDYIQMIYTKHKFSATCFINSQKVNFFNKDRVVIIF